MKKVVFVFAAFVFSSATFAQSTVNSQGLIDVREFYSQFMEDYGSMLNRYLMNRVNLEGVVQNTTRIGSRVSINIESGDEYGVLSTVFADPSPRGVNYFLSLSKGDRIAINCMVSKVEDYILRLEGCESI